MNREVMISNSPDDTLELGRRIGQKAGPGRVYALTGDLGVGKTAFAQGMAEGLGIRDAVTSPTFTILQVYEEGRLPFYHFDVYRIGDVTELDEIGFEEYIYGTGVSLVEWADLIPSEMPENSISIHIEKDPAQGFDYRRITIEDPGI